MSLPVAERSWVDQLERELYGGSSLLVTGPLPLRPYETIMASLWERFWHSECRNLAFTGTTRIGELPADAIGCVLRQPGPVERSEHLREGLRNQPVYCLLKVRKEPEEPESRLLEWLAQWAAYLGQYPNPAHPDSKLRVLLVPDWMEAASQLAALAPRVAELRLRAWPGMYEDELAAYARLLIDNEETFRALEPAEYTYLWLRSLDLAGGSKPDLEQAVRLARETKRASGDQEWLHSLSWTPNDPWVDTVRSAWTPWVGRRWQDGLLSLVDRGGMVIGTVPSDLDALVHNLWEAGLWVNSRGLQRMGWLTPAAITALKAKCASNPALGLKVRSLSPAFDRIANDLLNRCLIQERLLKQRFLEHVEAQGLAEQLRNLLQIAPKNGISLWDRILRQSPERTNPDPMDMIWDLSLGQFLILREQLTGLNTEPYKTLLDARNNLAHGRPATWAMFRDTIALDTRR